MAVCLRATLLFLVGAAFLSVRAFAGSPPDTNTFIIKVAASSAFEVEISKLALERSKNAAVRGFAEQMVADHAAASIRLKEAITEVKLKEPPFALDAKHKEIYDQLSAKSGGGFNKAYIDAQFEAHKEAVELFEAYAAGGENPRIKRFAEHLLPTLRLHLEHISKLWKSGPP
jgi:putative membrane protein